ncbi:MAG: carbon-nitrogen hydrolase family protein [Deltaproteobacteria bacterium]|nr:MAG: carbon-nitrogen hydrolase family protein [Deltaproteobacteria bacterium]
MMKENVRVAIIQSKPYPELDDPRNVGHAVRLLEQCQGKDVDVACLPEYFPWAGEDVLAGMARKLRCYIVAGLIEDLGEGRFNTATLFDRNGRLVGRQRKANLGSVERRHFGLVPGDDSYRVFETDFGRIGLPVSIDFWGQPDAARVLTEQGADLLINQGTFSILRGHWKQGALVRAFDNFIPVVGINTADFNSRIGGRVYRQLGGHSITIQPPKLLNRDDFGRWLRSLDSLEEWVSVELDEREQVFVGEVDLGTTRRFRSEFWSRLGFRRHRVS